MFQRFKGFNLDSFLDSKIAEEQARQTSQSRPSSSSATKRTPSAAAARRSTARTDSPSSRKAGSRLRAQDGDAGIPVKGPDPEDFVIGDDASDISRAATPLPATPQPVKEDADGAVLDEKKDEELKNDKEEVPDKQEATVSAEKVAEHQPESAVEDDLPEEVRKKLAKLEALTTRYQDLLRNYRTAHARVASIEPFEATLREYTPLTSISDPGALVEFLNQRSVQSEMVMEELKRVSAENREIAKEREELKVKLEDAEKKAKDAFDDVAGLPKDDGDNKAPAHADPEAAEKNPLNVGSEATRKHIERANANVQATNDDETFFSYETELPRLEAEVQQNQSKIEEQQDYINELSTENATLRSDLDVCQLDLDAMRNKTSTLERQQRALEIEHKIKVTEVSTLQAKIAEFQGTMEKQQQEHDENLKNGKYVQREEKMKEIHQNVVNALKDQVKQAEEAKKIAEGRVNELQFEIKRMESEANAAGEIITRLRGHESAAESWKKKVTEAEQERDEAQRIAESKKGHEATVASLRSQMKRAEKDRDAAYQMILDCGKCAMPEVEEARALETPGGSTPARSRGDSETTEQTEASTAPTEMSTPSLSVDGEPAATETKKKNKKKKSKAKKKESADAAAPATATTTPTDTAAPLPSIEELIANPEKAQELLSKRRDDTMLLDFVTKSMERLKEDREKDDEGHSSLLRHHEQVIEERDQTIRYNATIIREKDTEITTLKEKIQKSEQAINRLDAKLQGEDDLREEIDTLRESMVEAGSESTDAKHELKTLREQKQTLQTEFDEIQSENDRIRKIMKGAASERVDLETKYTTLDAELTELKRSQSNNIASEAELQGLQEKLEASEQRAAALQLTKEACEKQIEDLKAQHSANGAETDAKHLSLSNDFDELRSKASALETDLAAANQLAQSRYKDLTDLREHFNKVQPELKKLRLESEELKTVKADLERSSSSVKKLESKEKDLRSEIAEYKSQVSAKDGEIATLEDSAKKIDERNTALEDTYERTRKDLEQNERTCDEAMEKRAKLQAEFNKAEEELQVSKASLDELEKQVNKFRDEANSVREEMQLKSAQSASAQSYMNSMQESSRELATQMKEIKERNDNLEEELSDAHRLLSERGREGETMRRLLADVEGRAESKVKEMREKMDLATEERDRAEDEASSIGRRKAREIENLKNKVRDAERESSRATEAREDAERRERDFRYRQDDLEKKASQAQEEVAEVRTAMAQLRDALDEGERQSRDLEKDKSELRKILDEREARLEKLQKSSKSMAEELRSLQTANKLRQGGSIQSSRSSVESSRVTSPIPRGSNGAPVGGPQRKEVDYVYLKNVLLQFLEQKDKKHQRQLVPVLGMLLHFDQQDEQKWMTAISAR